MGDPNANSGLPQQLREADQIQQELLENATKISAFFKYLRLDDPVALDRALGRVGKSPECLQQSPEGGPKLQHVAIKTTVEYTRKLKKMKAHRQAEIDAARNDIKDLTPEEIMQQLESVFRSYCDKRVNYLTNRHEMDVVGFFRLLRDCRLLDNRLTLVQADVLFTQVEAEADATSIPADLRINYEEFLRCLRKALRIKFPSAKDMDAALLALAKVWVLPFQQGSKQPGAKDSLFMRQVMNMMRAWDRPLKRLFSWYCTLEEVDPQRVSWEYVRSRQLSIGSNEFVTMLLNFMVLPTLLTKQHALTIYTVCEAQNDGDMKGDSQLYPAFLETLAQTAISVADNALKGISAIASLDELAIYKAYSDCTEGALRERLVPDIEQALMERGRLFEPGQALPCVAFSRHAQEVRQQAEALQERDRAEAQMGVLQRREALRQRFALKRLKNFYKDVRTVNNNSTWPPQPGPDGPDGAHKGKHKRPGALEEDDESEEAGENPVAFFSDQRQIKPPVHIVVKRDPRWGHNRPSPSPHGEHPAVEAAMTLESGDIIPYVAAIINSPHGPHRSSHAHIRSTGALATAYHATSTHTAGRSYGGLYSPPAAKSPKAQLAPIEDLDESSRILDLLKKLPELRPPGEYPDFGSASPRGSGGGGSPQGTGVLPSPEARQRTAAGLGAPGDVLSRSADSAAMASLNQQHQRKLPPLPLPRGHKAAGMGGSGSVFGSGSVPALHSSLLHGQGRSCEGGRPTNGGGCAVWDVRGGGSGGRSRSTSPTRKHRTYHFSAGANLYSTSGSSTSGLKSPSSTSRRTRQELLQLDRFDDKLDGREAAGLPAALGFQPWRVAEAQ